MGKLSMCVRRSDNVGGRKVVCWVKKQRSAQHRPVGRQDTGGKAQVNFRTK